MFKIGSGSSVVKRVLQGNKVCIPAGICRELNLVKDTFVEFTVESGKLIITPVDVEIKVVRPDDQQETPKPKKKRKL